MKKIITFITLVLLTQFSLVSISNADQMDRFEKAAVTLVSQILADPSTDTRCSGAGGSIGPIEGCAECDTDGSLGHGVCGAKLCWGKYCVQCGIHVDTLKPNCQTWND